MTPRSELEDWLSELPPLDGGEDDPDTNEGFAEEIVATEDATSLDDASADDLDVGDGLDIANIEDAAAGDDDENWQADVGEPELDFTDGEPTSAADADGPGLSDGELELDEDLPPSDDDAGEEGTTDPVEHSLDEELPTLDADDEGDFEDALMLEAGMVPTFKDTLPWAQAVWQARSAPSKLPSWPDWGDDPPSTLAIAPAADAFVAITSAGAVFIAAEGAVSDGSDAIRAALDGAGPAFAAFSGGHHPVLWMATRDGRVAKTHDLGRTWLRCAGPGHAIAALAAREDGSVSVLARHDAELELSTSSDGARWFSRRVAADLPKVSPGRLVDAWMVHRGLATAIGMVDAVWIARDGERFARFAVPASAGTFAGAAADAPLVCACTSADEGATWHLVRVATDGIGEIIAELPAPEDSDDPEPVPALAWDEAHGTVRILSLARLSVWGPAPRDLT